MTDSRYHPLPDGVAYRGSGFVIDPARAYPAYLYRLDLQRDRYGVEVARRVMLAELTALTGQRRFLILGTPGAADWALAALPGTAEDDARAARDFRAHAARLPPPPSEPLP